MQLLLLNLAAVLYAVATEECNDGLEGLRSNALMQLAALTEPQINRSLPLFEGRVLMDHLEPGPTCTELEGAIGNGFAASSPSSSPRVRENAEKRLVRARAACGSPESWPDYVRSSGDSFEQMANQLDRPIFFLHISKSAGTFFCSCSRHMHLNPSLPGGASTNCHFLQEDRPMWGFHSLPDKFKIAHADEHTKTCEELASEYAGKGIDVEGDENYLANNGHVCPQFTNIVLIRHPILRLMSHLVHIMKAIGRNGVQDLLTETADSIFLKWPLVANNYLVRSLGGGDVYRLPFGKVTSAHLERAKAALREFDHVLIVGSDLTEDIKADLGWDCNAIPSQERRVSTADYSTEHVAEELRKRWSPDDWKRFIAHNELDLLLFKDARLLRALDRGLRLNPGPSEAK